MNVDLESPEPQRESKADRIALEYSQRYLWADCEALKLFTRVDVTNTALRQASARVHSFFLPGGRKWLLGVLRALYFAPDNRLSHAEIGRETGVSPANMTYQIDSLMEEGYVRRLPHESDRRISLVELSEKGRMLCELVIPARTRFITELGGVFTDDEKKTFNEYLERLEKAAEAYVPSE